MSTRPPFLATPARLKKCRPPLTIAPRQRRLTACSPSVRKRTGHESRLRLRTDRRHEHYLFLLGLRKRAARDARRKGVLAPGTRRPERHDRGARLGERRLLGGQLRAR